MNYNKTMEKRLKQENIEELRTIHKTLKTKYDADKIKCLVLWGEGWKWEDIEHALLISEHYIKDVVYTYNNHGIKGVLKHNWKSNNKKMTEEQDKELSGYLDENTMRTAAEVCDYVLKTYGIEYKEEWMVKKLHKLGFSYKKPKRCPAKPPTEEEQKKKIEEMQEIMNNLKENEDFFYIDGSGFQHNTKIDYGWIKKGKKKLIKTNTGRKRLNVNGAYNPLTNETICIETEENVSQQANIELVDKVIEKCPNKTVIHFYLDNAKYNFGKDYKEYINKIENEKGVKIILHNLLSYSPNLNLIERLWKYAKKKLLSNIYYEKYADFKKTIIDFFEEKVRNSEIKRELKQFIGLNFEIIKLDTDYY